MTEHWLHRFFKPQAMAIVGATEDRSRFGFRYLHNVLNFGRRERVYPVNPRAETILGLPCFKSIRDLPETPDHVGIIVAAERVGGVIEDCIAKGVPFATIFTGGFGEAGTEAGRVEEARLVAMARAGGLRLMGPNCNGAINFVDRIPMASTATVGEFPQPAGDIAVVGNSGGLPQVNVMWRAHELGLGISHEVSCGNEADLEIADFIDFFAHDRDTRVILVAAERIKTGAKFLAAAQAALAAEKPIVMLKLGRSEAGRRAAESHTGAIAGADAVADAALRQLGIIRVDDTDELYEAAMTLRDRRVPQGNRASAISVSGGNNALIADRGAAFGVAFEDFTEPTHAKLATLIPGYIKLCNPADMSSAALGRQDTQRAIMDTIAADPNVDYLLPVTTLQSERDIRAAADIVAGCAKPAALLWTGGTNDGSALAPRDLIRQGIPVFREISAGLKAVGAAMRYAEFRRGLARRSAPQRPADIDRAAAEGVLAGRTGALGERETKQLLAAYGLRTTREHLARDAAEAVRHATALGFPVALKVEADGLAHKSDVGGVRLALADAAAVQEGFAAILADVAARAPQARIAGVLVQEMAPPGVEMLLGVVNDAALGPAIAVGAGGILVELLADVVYRLPPVTQDEAGAMLRDLRAHRLLQGLRGRPAADEPALVDMIVRLSWLAADLGPRIAELDVNPVIVHARGQGATVVDGWLSLGPAP
jgi:acyl-CoA synthetase (NDP forming)